MAKSKRMRVGGDKNMCDTKKHTKRVHKLGNRPSKTIAVKG